MIYNYDTLSFQVFTIMRMKHPAGSFEVKRRPYAAISMKLSGGVNFTINGQEMLVSSKNIVYIPADVDYKAMYFEENDSVVIHLTECNYLEPQSIAVENKELIEHLFLSLLNSWEKNHSTNQAKAAIYDILFKLSQSCDNGSNALFSDISQYVLSNYGSPDLSIARICGRYGISRTKMQQLFWTCAGVSPKQYITNLRMDKVLRLLSENRLSVKEIASVCGFSDEKYFSRAFKERYGCSPSQLRKRIAI